MSKNFESGQKSQGLRSLDQENQPPRNPNEVPVSEIPDPESIAKFLQLWDNLVKDDLLPEADSTVEGYQEAVDRLRDEDVDINNIPAGKVFSDIPAVERLKILGTEYYHGTKSNPNQIKDEGFKFLLPKKRRYSHISFVVGGHNVFLTEDLAYAQEYGGDVPGQVIKARISEQAEIKSASYRFIENYIIPFRVWPQVNRILDQMTGQEWNEQQRIYFANEALSNYVRKRGGDVLLSGQDQIAVANQKVIEFVE